LSFLIIFTVILKDFQFRSNEIFFLALWSQHGGMLFFHYALSSIMEITFITEPASNYDSINLLGRVDKAPLLIFLFHSAAQW
jgi:hypothetical protein